MKHLPDRSLGGAQRDRRLGATATLQAGQDQGIPLSLGQASQFRQQSPSLDPAGHVILQVRARAGLRLELGGCPRGHDAGHPVADDLVKPAAEVADLSLGSESGKRAQERLLDHILGPPTGPQATGEAEQASLVALHDHDERPVMPRSRETDQTLVGLRSENEIREPRAHSGSTPPHGVAD